MISWGCGAKVLGVLLGAMLLFSSFQVDRDNFFQKKPFSQNANDNVPPQDEIKQAFAQTGDSTDNSPWSFLGQNQQNTWYSPQTIINSANVATLKQVWSITLPNIDGTPVISDGIVYATSATEGARYGEYVGNIYAINETTGKLIWKDGPNAQTGLSFSTIAGIAINNGNVFAGTTDSYLVSLNAKTGALNWKVPINNGLVENPQATHVGPQGTPLVWNGKIIIGNVIGNSVARGFVRAFSESDGALLWTFYTVPPSPMDSTNQGFYKNTWGACTYCGGGDNWNVPAVDPDTGIIYFGTGNPTPYFNATERSPSPEYLNLYANSVIALNATDGQMVWYFQEVARDTHNWDAGMPVQLFNTTINGEQRKVVGSGGKNGHYYLLDAATGKLIWDAKLGIHLNENQDPTPEGEITYPGAIGGINTYYTHNPMTNSIYTIAFNSPTKYISGPIGLDSPGGTDAWAGVEPNSTLYALNASTGEVTWSVNFPGLAGGVSSTNNLVFTADADGNYYAFNAQTGAVLWKYASGKSSPFLANWGPPSVTDGLLFETSFTDNGGVMAFAPSVLDKPPADWYDSSWTYAKKITVDQTVIDSDLTSFPLLVNITDTDLGSKAQLDCDDILFTLSNNVTKLNHEIENCDMASNWLTAWVNVNLSGTTDTIIYMYYGNPSATNQQNVVGTWKSSYELVAHLNDDFLDSTSNNNDGTNSGTTNYPNQYIADSQSFDGINDSIKFGTDMPDDATGTISVWVRPTDTVKDSYITTSASDDLAIVMGYAPEDNFFDIYDDGTYPCGQTNMQMPATKDAWQLIAYSYDDINNDVYGFKNGALVKSNLNCSIEGEKTFLMLGSYYLGLDYLQGQIDEFRFSTDFYNNDDWFKARYECAQGGGGCITIGNESTKNPSNNPPVAVDDSASTNEDTPITIAVLANDSDPDNDTLTVNSIAIPPANGVAVINPNNTITYTPDQDFAGSNFFDYTISDGKGGTDTARVSITINSVNDAPDARDDNATTNKDTPANISVLSNDVDVDGDSLTVTSVTTPSAGVAVINPDNTVKYTPNQDFVGSDSFSYSISDGRGGSDSALVTVNVTAPPPPANYVVDLLDVYASNSTALDSGTVVCLNIDLEAASSCATALNAGSTYRFEIEVDNRGGQAGSPTTLEFRDVVAANDVLGTIPVGNILNSGCGANTNWIESIVTDDARAVNGTACSIGAGGSVEYWMVITLNTDANDGTGTFFISDGTITDTSTITTFTVNTPPSYNIDLLDVYASNSTALDSGTAVCLNVDTDTAQACATVLNPGATYRFEIEVDNIGEQAGSPNMFQFRDMIAPADVFGSIPVGNILNSGCGANTNWIESIVTDDAQSDAGTTCSIAGNGTQEYWMVITLDTDADDGSGSWYVKDASGRSDTSSTTSFTVNPPALYVIDLLDVYASSSTALDSGTPVCLDVDLENASSCGTALIAGSTYRFEIEVDNTGDAGSPTTFDIDSAIGTGDTLGSIVVGNILNSGCSTNTNWSESIVDGTDARASSGTTCSISAGGSVEYWMIVTLATDADDDTSTFTITDGTINDTSTTTTFTVNPPATAIVLNGIQTTSSTVSSSPYQITLSNFNAGTGSDRLLVVGVEANNNWVTSITFGGVQLTQKVQSFNWNDAEFWYLTNPTGTGNIVVTMSGPTSVVVGAYSFSGVDQTNPLPTSAINTGSGSPTISITTLYPNSWVLDSPSIWGGVTLGSPTCTQEWDVNIPDAITGASSSTIQTSPGLVTCSWTASSGDLWDDVAIEVKASG